MNNLKISVIIPCYNVQDYLNDCFDSVLSQTFKDFEIICVEDASTDNTSQILKDYENKIHIIYNQNNKGLAESRNIGLNSARGEYIYFLDSDDTISPDCLEVLYNKISQDNSDMVMSEIEAYPQNHENQFCVQHAQHLNKWLEFSPFDKCQISEANVLDYYHKLHCCAVNKLYKKSFLIENNIYFIHQKCFHEDNGFWFKILSCNPTISGIGGTTYFYRVRNGSISDQMDIDEKAHQQNLSLSLKDALTFVKKRRNQVLSDFIYYEIYRQKRHRFISLVWLRYEKHLTVFWVTIFKMKFNAKKGKYTLKIFGIPVFKWRKKDV